MTQQRYEKLLQLIYYPDIDNFKLFFVMVGSIKGWIRRHINTTLSKLPVNDDIYINCHGNCKLVNKARQNKFYLGYRNNSYMINKVDIWSRKQTIKRLTSLFLKWINELNIRINENNT